jgi:nitrite reductase/ring-hydroxylating ferredoxin subunit
MGNLLRRYWQPFLYSWEVEAGGPPLRIRLFSEDLVVFRNADGQPALIGGYCPHAAAPMAYAENEGDGLRCLLHYWKFDETGRCTELPGEAPGSPLSLRARVKAYRCVEWQGIVFAYLGRWEDPLPPPPSYPWAELPTSQVRYADKHVRAGNWLQVLEHELGGSDQAAGHSPLGLAYSPPIGAVGESLPGGPQEGRLWVPIDDEHTLEWRVAWDSTKELVERLPEVALAPEQRRIHYAQWWPATQVSLPPLDSLMEPEPAGGEPVAEETAEPPTFPIYRRLIEAARVFREQGTLPAEAELVAG